MSDALRALIEKWRERETRLCKRADVAEQAGNSLYARACAGQAESIAVCADELEAALAAVPVAPPPPAPAEGPQPCDHVFDWDYAGVVRCRKCYYSEADGQQPKVCWCDRYKAVGGGTCEPCQLTALQQRLREVEAELAALDRVVPSRPVDGITLLDRVTSFVAQWQTTNVLIESWRTESDKAYTTVVTLQERIKEVEAERDAATLGCRELQSVVDVLATENAHMQERSIEADAKVTALQQRVAEVEAERDRWKATAAAEAHACNDLVRDNDALVVENEALQQRVARLTGAAQRNLDALAWVEMYYADAMISAGCPCIGETKCPLHAVLAAETGDTP